MTNLHSLIPFDRKSLPFTVVTRVARDRDLLILQYSLTDPANEVEWPTQQNQVRQDYLWESTCFEAFIGTPHQAEYFEVNLSPSKAWNAYRFDDYRSPNTSPPEWASESTLQTCKIVDRTIYAIIDLHKLNLSEKEIHLGLTAVIKTPTALHYLALHHPKSQADFHDSMGWTIRLLPDEQFPE